MSDGADLGDEEPPSEFARTFSRIAHGFVRGDRAYELVLFSRLSVQYPEETLRVARLPNGSKKAKAVAERVSACRLALEVKPGRERGSPPLDAPELQRWVLTECGAMDEPRVREIYEDVLRDLSRLDPALAARTRQARDARLEERAREPK
jgi:hypothetical protein